MQEPVQCDIYPYAMSSNWFREPCPNDLAFWSRYLAGIARRNDLTSHVDFTGSSSVFWVPKQLLHNLQKFASKYESTLYQSLLVASSLTVQSHQQTQDIVLGIPDMNRINESECNTVGLFLQPLPFRLNLSNATSTSVDFATEQAKSSLRSIREHALPWHRLLSHLGIEYQQHGNEHPIFDTVVTIHDHRDTSMPLLTINGVGRPEHIHTTGAKFGLLLEFTVFNDDEMALRMEYSSGKWNELLISKLYRGLEAAITAMCEGVSVHAIWERVAEQMRWDLS